MRRDPHNIAVLAILVSATTCRAGSLADTRPPGSYFPLSEQTHAKTESFRSGRPVVGTTYFYWYDVYSGAHIRNPDGTDALTTHPPAAAMADVSYKSADWHYAQLRDIAEAAIDFILPVFWGVPGQYDSWSFAGLPPLVAAHNRMAAESKSNPTRPAPPKIGLFYDTSTLQYNRLVGPDITPGEPVDLTTDAGREWFYVTIRDFFSMIPPDKWARVDGRPIVFLYSAGFAKAVDDRVYPDVRQRFRKDFGTDLFIVRETSWPGRADASYRWGGALGLTLGESVAGIGPGYDHSAVPGRQPLVVNRQNGEFYAGQWKKLLRLRPTRRPWMVHVETWNEWHEGTDVARSQEYGDHYIRATAEFARMFRAAVQLDPSGPFAAAERVRWSGRQTEGVELRPSGGDGCWQAGAIDGSPAVTGAPCSPDAGAAYLYFRVDDAYMFDEQDRSAEITLVFRDDGGCAQFRVEYDNSDPAVGPQAGAFRPTRDIVVGATGTWRTVKLILPQVRFIDRTNGADFRISITGHQRRLTVREVIVRKLIGVEIKTSDSGRP
ncbi:MAG: DUF5010 domain-containing protein [Planctomycetes bacterium]|nr:DUF5010 domain-containing protein [Planctomycetota bacterium]